MTAPRWWLLVMDVRGHVIYNQGFLTRRGAHRHGRAITTPPLNRYEIRRAPRWGSVTADRLPRHDPNGPPT